MSDKTTTGNPVACEICWTEASRKAAMTGGTTFDLYREELAPFGISSTGEETGR